MATNRRAGTPKQAKVGLGEFHRRLAATQGTSATERAEFFDLTEERAKAEARFHRKHETDQVKAEFDKHLRNDLERRLAEAGFDSQKGSDEIPTWATIGMVPLDDPRFEVLKRIEREHTDVVADANAALGINSIASSSNTRNRPLDVTASDTACDTPKKSRMKNRPVTKEALECAQAFKRARKIDPTIKKTRFILDYAEQEGLRGQGLKKRLEAHSELFDEATRKRHSKRSSRS